MEPREHHYIFAHRILPALFFENPFNFIGSANLKGEEMLKSIWSGFAQEMIEDKSQRLDSERLAVTAVEEHSVLGTLITLPQPEAMAECYYVCAMGELKKNFFGRVKIKKPKFFTLELGVNLDGENRTVFCSWLKNGTHLNFGGGCEPNPKEFINLCLGHAGK